MFSVFHDVFDKIKFLISIWRELGWVKCTKSWKHMKSSAAVRRIPSGLFGHKCGENSVSIWRIPQRVWCIMWISHIYPIIELFYIQLSSCFTRIWGHSHIYPAVSIFLFHNVFDITPKFISINTFLHEPNL